MYRVLFSIGNIDIHAFGIMLLIGIIAGSLVIVKAARRYNLVRSISRQYLLLDIVLWTIFSGLIGARIGHVLLYSSLYQEINPINIVFGGGFVYWFGFIFALLAFVIIAGIHRLDIRRWLDIMILGMVVGAFFVHLGVLLSGDYQAQISTSVISVDGRVPTPLYLALGDLGLVILWRKIYFKLSNISGLTFCWTVGLLTALDFLVNFWQFSSVVIGPLNLAQLIDLGVVLGVVIIGWSLYVRR